MPGPATPPPPRPSPPLGHLLGLLLLREHPFLGEVWAPAVPTPGHHVWARVASSPRALHRAPVVGRRVPLFTKRTPGGCSGSGVAPRAAPAAERIRPSPSKTLTSYRRSRSRTPLLQRRINAALSRAASTTSDEAVILHSFQRAWTSSAPARPPNPRGDSDPLVIRLWLLPEPPETPIPLPMYRGRFMLWTSIHVRHCCGTKPVTLESASRAALSTCPCA